jgi:hypothetical protein
MAPAQATALLLTADFAPMVQLQQLYNASELFRPSSSQHITNNVHALAFFYGRSCRWRPDTAFAMAIVNGD